MTTATSVFCAERSDCKYALLTFVTASVRPTQDHARKNNPSMEVGCGINHPPLLAVALLTIDDGWRMGVIFLQAFKRTLEATHVLEDGLNPCTDRQY